VRLVVHHNTCTGTHDCLATYVDAAGPGHFDRYAGIDNDYDDNKAIQLQDDVFEGGSPVINWRIWNNWEQQTGTCLSDAWYDVPAYYFRDQCWRNGAQGLQYDANGYTEPSGICFKYGSEGGTTGTLARIYVVNNTFWTDWVNPNGAGVSGGGAYFSGGNGFHRFFLRNYIFAETQYGWAYPPDAWSNPGVDWNEDYD